MLETKSDPILSVLQGAISLKSLPGVEEELGVVVTAEVSILEMAAEVAVAQSE
jgi:hypothetical protein